MKFVEIENQPNIYKIQTWKFYYRTAFKLNYYCNINERNLPKLITNQYLTSGPT
jgi:hypothetical protein